MKRGVCQCGVEMLIVYHETLSPLFIHSFIHSFWPCPNLDLQETMQEKRRSILSFKKKLGFTITNDLSLKSDQKSASMCVCFLNFVCRKNL